MGKDSKFSEYYTNKALSLSASVPVRSHCGVDTHLATLGDDDDADERLIKSSPVQHTSNGFAFKCIRLGANMQHTFALYSSPLGHHSTDWIEINGLCAVIIYMHFHGAFIKLTQRQGSITLFLYVFRQDLNIASAPLKHIQIINRTSSIVQC